MNTLFHSPSRRQLRRAIAPVFVVLFLVVFALAGVSVPSVTLAQKAAPKDSLRVLFIGNSYTYFNNLPRQVQALAEVDAGARPIAVRMVAPGGMTLKGHIAGSEALPAIKSQKWDVVVLQEQSALANPVMHDGTPEPGAPDAFFAAARSLDSAVKQRGARTVFYETWARVGQPQHTVTIATAYERIAKELGATLAPVGRAFATARTERPALALNIEDKSHPTPVGSYLAACVIYETITGRAAPVSSSHIAGRAITFEGVATRGDTTALVSLTPADARYLQGVARRSVAGVHGPVP